jgi:flagellar basal body-associated protein FliL
MKFIEKLEDKLNAMIIKGWQLFMKLIISLIPNTLKMKWANFLVWKSNKIIEIKAKILLRKQKLQELKNNPKYSIKDALKKSMDELKVIIAAQKNKKFSVRVIGTLNAPFLVIQTWVGQLSIPQKTLLYGMTMASIIGGVIVYQTSGEVYRTLNPSRAPASIEESYVRPDYYKKQERELSFNTIRLPVFIQNINELRALIIDFSVVTSNRNTKKYLAKHEFELRDHLIGSVEPIIPSFPLEEEGRQVLREKLKIELNNFLVANKVEGQVLEIKVVYALAH